MNQSQQSTAVNQTNPAVASGAAPLAAFQCYSDRLKVCKDFDTMAQLCEHVGADEATITDAIKHHDGNLGAFHFEQN